MSGRRCGGIRCAACGHHARGGWKGRANGRILRYFGYSHGEYDTRVQNALSSLLGRVRKDVLHALALPWGKGVCAECYLALVLRVESEAPRLKEWHEKVRRAEDELWWASHLHNRIKRELRKATV